jgi:hypothetical protein
MAKVSGQTQTTKPYVRPSVVFRGDIMNVTKGLADAGGDTGFTLANPS